jgi:hypothetical protein
MADTDSLITELSAQAPATKTLPRPRYFICRVLVVLIVYAIGVQGFNHLRPDIWEQLATRPAYGMELLLLAAISISSVLAAIVSMYPDAYQRPALLKLPYIFLGLLTLLLEAQFFMPMNPHMRLLPFTLAGHECSLSIAAIAMLPSAMIFLVLRQGASVRPLQAGSFAVLASASIGCLCLRITEQNDSLAHLVSFHYAPTLLFAALGALAGKWLIRW